MIVKKPEAELSLGKKLKGSKTNYYVLSSKGDKNLGGPYTLKQAKERLRQVEYFKHNPEEENPRKQLYIKPNQAAIKAARKGLDARKLAPKSKKGGLSAMQAKEAGVGSGVMRARDIVSGKRVNAYQVKAFFDRHRQNYVDAKTNGLKPQESKAIQAWLLWGGEPLRKQAEAAIKKDRRQNPTVSGNGRRNRLREDKPVESVVVNPMFDPQDNPRPSKVKNALAAEAVRHGDFEEFAKKYWLDCARGIYWYATNDDRFKITDKELGLSKAKKFIVSCNPEFAFKGVANENKKYVAELNVNNLDAKDFEVVRGTDGNKIKIISNLDLVQITRIMDQDKSFRSWKYQQSILPSSKEQLKEFWKDAHRKHKIKEEKEAKRQKRLQRKEDKKLKKEVEKKYSAQPNPLAAGMQLPPRHHGPTVVEGKKAQYSYAGRDGDYDLYQTGNVMIGVIDMEIQEPEFDWKDAADRFYAYNTHSYHEGFAPTMAKALDKAFVGYPNPRVKNPGILDMGPTDKHVTLGIRETPRHVNNPKY